MDDWIIVVLSGRFSWVVDEEKKVDGVNGLGVIELREERVNWVV